MALLSLYEGDRGIAHLKLPSHVTLRASFDLELHPNGRPLLCGGGTSAFTVSGRYVGPNDERIPKNVPLALRYVYTLKNGGEVASSRTLAQRNISELATIQHVPAHPSIVKPYCWFTTPQDAELIGLSFAYRSPDPRHEPQPVPNLHDDYATKAVVVVFPLFDYVLCDTRNKSRSFVHCHPEAGERYLNIFMEQLREAIRFLQERCIVHNDVKADNIVVRPDTSVACGWRVALIDFGDMRVHANEDLILGAREIIPAGAPDHKLPSVLRGQKGYMDADYYALALTEIYLRKIIVIETGRLRQDALDERDATIQASERTIEQLCADLIDKAGIMQQLGAALIDKESQLEEMRAEIHFRDQQVVPPAPPLAPPQAARPRLEQSGAAAALNDVLRMATKYGHTACIRELALLGANVTTTDRNGCTTVLVAAQNGHAACITELARLGANINIRDRDGWTPVFVAAQSGSAACLTELARLGANVDTQNEHGWTPMHVAAFHGHTACLAELARLGANVNATNRDGSTPVQIAARNGRALCVTELRQLGANIQKERACSIS